LAFFCVPSLLDSGARHVERRGALSIYHTPAHSFSLSARSMVDTLSHLRSNRGEHV
jgi:hypothetical protein